MNIIKKFICQRKKTNTDLTVITVDDAKSRSAVREKLEMQLKSCDHDVQYHTAKVLEAKVIKVGIYAALEALEDMV